MIAREDASGFVDEVKDLDANLSGFTAWLSAEPMGFQLDDGASGPRRRLVPFVFWPADKPGPPDVTDEPASAPSSDAGAPPEREAAAPTRTEGAEVEPASRRR